MTDYIDNDEMTWSLNTIRQQSDPHAFQEWCLQTICPDCPLARKAIDGEQ